MLKMGSFWVISTINSRVSPHLSSNFSTNLVSILRHGNALTGSIPYSMQDLKHLAVLTLHENSLDGQISRELHLTGACNLDQRSTVSRGLLDDEPGPWVAGELLLDETRKQLCVACWVWFPGFPLRHRQSQFQSQRSSMHCASHFLQIKGGRRRHLMTFVYVKNGCTFKIGYLADIRNVNRLNCGYPTYAYGIAAELKRKSSGPC